MKKKVVLLIPAVLILLSVLGAGATAGNFSAGPANKGSAYSSSPVSSAGYEGNGAVYVYQEGAAPTALTVDAPASTTIYAGETLTVGLRLVRTDTYEGIPNAVIRGHYSQDGINWSEPGSVRTDGNGQFSYTGTVPDKPGTYQGYLSYDGDATYQGCESPIYTITVVSQAGPSLDSTPADSKPVATAKPADSKPIATAKPADSKPVATALKPTPVPTDAATNAPTSLTSSTDPSSSGMIAGDQVHALMTFALILWLAMIIDPSSSGMIAGDQVHALMTFALIVWLAMIAILKFRKKLT
jgi:hypothetical protein